MPAVIVSLLVMASLVLGYLRDGLVAYYFGASWHTDLYFLALLIPLFMENSLAVGIRDTLIVAFSREREKGGDDFRRLAGQSGTLVLLGGFVLVLALVLTGDFWIGLFGGDWMRGHGSTVIRAYEIGILMIATTLWSYYQMSLFHVERSFVWPAWRSVLFNLGGIFFLMLVWRSIEGLLLGMLLGQLVHILLLQRHLRETKPVLPSSGSRKQWAGLLPAFAIMTAVALFMQFSIGVERLLSSWTGMGELARLSYAFRIVSVPLTLFAISVVGISYARFSRLAATDNAGELKRAMADTQRGCLFFLVPMAVLMYGYAEPVLQLLLCRGAFNIEDVQRTAQLMKIYAIGLPAAGMALVIMRFLAAVGEFRRLLVAVGAVQVVICQAYVAVYRGAGVFGLATVTAVGAFAQSVVLWRALPASMRIAIALSDQLSLMMIIVAMIALSLLVGSGVAGLVSGCISAVLLPLLITSVAGIREDVIGSLLRMLGRHD